MTLRAAEIRADSGFGPLAQLYEEHAGSAYRLACGYVALIYQEGDSQVAWYLALVCAGVAALLVSAAGSVSRFPVILAIVLLGSAAIVASASIGFLLLPAVVAAGIAIVAPGPQRVQT